MIVGGREGFEPIAFRTMDFYVYSDSPQISPLRDFKLNHK